MKHLLLVLAFAAVNFTTTAQTLTNADFETWDMVPYEAPASYWITSNYVYLPQQGLANVTKVTGHTGSYALRLQTYKSGTDVAAGFLTNTLEDIEAGEGGQPYTSQPTHFEGVYRYSLPALDTALLIVIFKKNGTVISSNIIKIKGTGTLPVFTPFNFALSPLPVAPDSVIIAALSSNILAGDMSKAQNGSWLELDALQFTGLGPMLPITDGGFEGWNTLSFETPGDWKRGGGFFSVTVDSCVKRSSDKYSGSYALQLETKMDNYLQLEEMGMVSQQMSLNPSAVDSIVGYYKYTTPGTDTAMMNVQFMSGTTPLPLVLGYVLPPVNTYTRFALEIDPAGFPAGATGVEVSFQSSSYIGPTSGIPMSPVVGSRLLVDGLSIAKQNLSVKDVATNKTLECSVYPNPATDNLHIAIKTPGIKDVHITLHDLTGKIVYVADRKAAENIFVPVAHLSPGNYYYTIKTGAGVAKGEFTKK